MSTYMQRTSVSRNDLLIISNRILTKLNNDVSDLLMACNSAMFKICHKKTLHGSVVMQYAI